MPKSLKWPLKGTLLAAVTGLLFAGSEKAHAYPIDCAILLCLAGGWPSSAECTAARAKFIRRITPWPIEPPLQIWRCPMGASYRTEPGNPMQRLYDATFPAPPMQSFSTAEPEIVPAVFKTAYFEPSAAAILELVAGDVSDANGRADVDISDPVFDFVRSIRVWDVRTYRHRPQGSDGGCHEFAVMNLGSYGTQGDFAWRLTGPGSAPAFVIPSRACTRFSGRRGVGVEWTDYEGNHDFEWVSY